MKKIFSLIKATMTSDMNLFKIKSKNSSHISKILLPIFLVLCFMFTIYSYSDGLYERLNPLHLEHIVLAISVLAISILTLIEGVYKSGPLLFNCKDDQMLLSLPIEKRTVLFIRIFKFYIFELLFNSMFLIPIMIGYIKWAEMVTWTFYLTSIIMLFLLPIIPIVISCLIAAITTSITSIFKYKHIVQTVLSMGIVIGIVLLSSKLNEALNYILTNTTKFEKILNKIYYPASIYSKLARDFNTLDLIIFIIINLLILIIAILILSKVYFKINSRIKKVTSIKKTNINKLKIKSQSIYKSLIKKEMTTFFKTPVFIINAGFSLVLFLILCFLITKNYDGLVKTLTDPKNTIMPLKMINEYKSLIVLMLIILTSFTTSITNSVISLEGRRINILKSLPISTKTILISKILFALVLTTPILLLGDIILFIKLKLSIIELLLLLILSILIPSVSHITGLLINLKFPKLNYENSTEVIKQSTSSFLAVTLGMILLLLNIGLVFLVIEHIKTKLLLLLFTICYLIIDILLYILLIKVGIKVFNKLTI